MPPATKCLEKVFNHIVLPSRLPGEQDSPVDNIGVHITQHALNATNALLEMSKGDSKEIWDGVKLSLEICHEIHANGHVDHFAVMEAFGRMDKNMGIILYIDKQNSGLYIRQVEGDSGAEEVIFEAFEASPAAKSVLQSQDALICDFPGSSVSIQRARFQDQSFQESLALFLEQASEEMIEQFAAKARKAGASIVEARDTPDPHLITQMLMTLLEAQGSQISTPKLRKRVRDDVCWTKAYTPWRRSPLYLVIRVCIQRLLYSLHGPEIGRVYYKFFICAIHTALLKESIGILSVESCHLLIAKLSRRLSKLEMERQNSSGVSYQMAENLFNCHGSWFEAVIQTATRIIEDKWASFKGSVQKFIPILPHQADQAHLHLKLPNSASYLQQLLSRGKPSRTNTSLHSTSKSLNNVTCSLPYNRFADRYSSLKRLETELKDRFPLSPADYQDNKCGVIAEAIERYLDNISNSYDDCIEQKSAMMVGLFQVWAIMDIYAVHQFPLLKDYRPPFPPEVLDVLQLSKYEDLVRLQDIQRYLQRRETGCKFNTLTLFSAPVKNCFADLYVRCSPDAARLHQLGCDIETACSAAKDRKEMELNQVNNLYLSLSRQIKSAVCTRKQDPPGTCTHCKLKKQRKKLQISVHEDFLPKESSKDLVQRRVILFELAMPSCLAAYRDVSWRILTKFGTPKDEMATSLPSPKVHLSGWGPLSPYVNHRGLRFQLASTTKSFLVSHYKGSALPATVEQILLPFGLRLSYYDTREDRWAEHLTSAFTFAHSFGLHQSVLTLLGPENASEFVADADGLSSYKITSIESKCPDGLSTHEYMAYQSLLAGKATRWLSVLRELGSSNINFSSEAAMHLFNYLATQAGPNSDGNPLRVIHAVFEDITFCTRLIHQIESLLQGISDNWRESFCMELVITLALRLRSLGPEQVAKEGRRLLLTARQITSQWIYRIRKEIGKDIGNADSETAQRLSSHALSAALLCKRTFEFDCDHEQDGRALEIFIRACLSVSENMTLKPEDMPATTRGFLIRDIQTTVSNHKPLKSAIQSHPETLQLAISSVWPEAADSPREYRPWRFISGSDMWVASIATSSELSRPQSVHYHILEGHLLIDHKPIGKLPAEIQHADCVQELFGRQHLLVFPSAMKDMTYCLSWLKSGHQIHFGRYEGKIAIRAHIQRTTLEFVERSAFGTGIGADLPSPLLDEHLHWLDLSSGELEIRRRAQPWWYKRPGNWLLHMATRQVSRRQSLLVDPHSSIFRQIAGIFEHFESADKLVVLQPPTRNLSVELKRVDLDFTVNQNGSLLCRQLHAEVDPDQDAGTWYGLQSKIVLRDSQNYLRRSIIVPIGSIQYCRHDVHVLVRMVNDGRYGRYLIDDTLGRLDCAPEPLLVYTKSQLHAFTSFPLPDTLTGRTGTEEALSCLASAQSQPWTPLGPAQCLPLHAIARLTPARKYYPLHLKRQQDVTWDKNLTMTIQHDQFLPAVERIFAKAERLARFTSYDIQRLNIGPDDSAYLRERNYTRRHRFERPDAFPRPTIGCRDIWYDGRDKLEKNTATSNVFEIINILHTNPSGICTTTDLVQLFDGIPHIAGYTEWQNLPLGDLLTLDIGMEWGRLVSLCRESSNQHLEVMFTLGTIAFADHANMSFLRSLAAICILKDAKNHKKLPSHTGYSGYQLNDRPTLESLETLIGCDTKLLNATFRRASFFAIRPESFPAHERRALAEELLQQWPCRQPSNSNLTATRIDVKKAIECVQVEWQRLYKNFEFTRTIQAFQSILNRHQRDSNPRSSGIPLPSPKWYSAPIRDVAIPTISKLLPEKGPISFRMEHASWSMLPSQKQFVNPAVDCSMQASQAKPKNSPEIQELTGIFAKLASSKSAARTEYVQHMKDSLFSLQYQSEVNQETEKIPDPVNLQATIYEIRNYLGKQLAQIRAFFAVNDKRYRWLHVAQLWPCLSPITVLQQLRSTNSHNSFSKLKDAILSYGLSITYMQQILRIQDASLKNDVPRLQDEYNNPGHINWKPSEFPDWLLMEIEANLLIREIQVAVARATILPESRSNSVLQLNMGQGKTSVIMPMVACVLANGHNLARLVVPKALLLQTAQIIQSRLGGLVGREVYHIPFSRKSPTDAASVQEYEALHKESLGEYGIVLTTPEHLLSFKLCGLQCLSDSNLVSARYMISISDWLARVCRDVVDESDFSLAVKTQLIYPSGSQLPLDGHPYRWKVAHALLTLAKEHLEEAQGEFPTSFELVKRADDSFPFIHIHRPDLEPYIHQRLADDLCSGRTSILPAPAVGCQQALWSFISHSTVDDSVVTAASQAFTETMDQKKTFLLRGLLGHGILWQCLTKRWNVQYGLHPKRDPVAVPFHAKGVPSEQAEWGHPDVSIMLTYLSFYYSGLTLSQLRLALQSLSDSDDPSSEYDGLTSFVKTLPESLQHWNLVNTDDEDQLNELWEHLRYSMTVINYFLDNIVFPIHARHFPQRLQMSGWDIPLFTAVGSSKPRESSISNALTTGFSGTNDNRGLLPLTIQQNDLPELFHTNAEVLTYLLQPRNRRYVIAEQSDGKRLAEIDFIKKLEMMGIRILIDAGAHILELDNQSFVRKWMEIDWRAPAAVYFDAGSKPWVMDRNNKEVPLLASPFAGDLGDCLVYLDEAHTRGTDLKFPPFAKGALTLSLGQTKDHTIQAAMRLRQLGKSQSVVFIASPDVNQSILDFRQKAHKDELDSADVVAWLLEQSCRGNENLQRLYLNQGYDFCRRVEAASTYKDFLSNQHHREALLGEIIYQEEQTLEQLYIPKSDTRAARIVLHRPKIIKELTDELDRQRLNLAVGNVTTLSEFMEVEQERELEAQVEEVRDNQRPVFFQPLEFPGLHPVVLRFATTGELHGPGGYELAFAALRRTTLGRKYGVCGVGRSKLFLSAEFTKTIAGVKNGAWLDDFLRPVHWILWSPTTDTALVIIPEEAECLIPTMRAQNTPTTHLLVYAAPFTRKMLLFNQLDFYALPPLNSSNQFPTALKIELGILSGRLYLNFDEYGATVQYLRMDNSCAIEKSGNSGNPVPPIDKIGNDFAKDPVGFLQEWLAVTRKGREFGHTPVGYICQGRPLSKSHSFFSWGTSTSMTE